MLGRFKVFPARRMHPAHGPQSWPWWRLLSVTAVKCWPSGVRFNYNVWFYTRWGAWPVQVVWDTRPGRAGGV